METSSPSPGMDVCLLQPSLWLEFLSLLCQLWVTWLPPYTNELVQRSSYVCVLLFRGFWALALLLRFKSSTGRNTLRKDETQQLDSYKWDSETFNVCCDHNSAAFHQTSTHSIYLIHILMLLHFFYQWPPSLCIFMLFITSVIWSWETNFVIHISLSSYEFRDINIASIKVK